MEPQPKLPWELLGEEFVKQYYLTFDSNRVGVLPMYHQQAMITFEDHRGHGHEQIKQILSEKLRFQKIQHIVTKIDCQPSKDEGVMILVTGRLKADDDPPHAYSQTFFVQPDAGNYFIFHDIFRLSIHDTL